LPASNSGHSHRIIPNVIHPNRKRPHIQVARRANTNDLLITVYTSLSFADGRESAQSKFQMWTIK